MKLDHVRTAIAFGAHPDDVEVGAGGLVAKLVGAGASVTIVIASIPNRYAVRRAEGTASAAHLGARVVFPPGEAETRIEDIPMYELVARFEREISAVDPDLVIVQGAHDLHWDHTLVHRAVLAALRRARSDILAYATRLPPGTPSPPATCVVDITTSIDRKLAAIAEHTSQFPAGFVDARRDVARSVGHAHGMAFGEVYEVLRIAL